MRPRLRERGRRGLALGLGFALCLLLVLAAAAPPAAADQPDREKLPQPANFNQCLKYALSHSPRLLRSALEIRVRSIDESDARWEFAPSVKLFTRYYFTRPRDVERAYDIKLRTEDYNPVGAYFTLQARRQLTRIAVASHGMLIEEGVHRLAQDFLRVRTLHHQSEFAQERIQLAQRTLAYARSLRDTGSATGLQVELAEQALDVARIAALEVNAAKQGALNKVKILMGMDPSYQLELDLEAGYQQLMSDFKPAQAGLGAARKHSFDLKVADIKEKLQDMNIIMAYTKFLPSLHMYLETTDPLSGEEQGTMYFSVGLEVPLWDGLSRVRNISRQKVIRRQIRADRRDTDHELVGRWQAAQDRLRQADASSRLGRSRSRLAALQERESLIRYQSHQIKFPDFAERRVDHLEALGKEAEKELDHALAVLDLRRITGDLTDSYVQGEIAGSKQGD